MSRNCLIKHVIEGKIEARKEVTGRRGRKFKQLLNDLKENESNGILMCAIPVVCLNYKVR